MQAREVRGELTGPGGFPVARATVEILETGESERTDGFGGFTLAGVPEGAFTVRVTADDFEPVEVSGSAATTYLSVALTEIRSNTASIEVVARAEDLR
ncbi:MAG: carboxypeptidase-like regulatory domain-containing protein, partial [Bryobacterales bacterium]|nr:carboxypeptidase-like regulatory domain-containing protein [Bryobacterales bacterium]